MAGYRRRAGQLASDGAPPSELKMARERKPSEGLSTGGRARPRGKSLL